MRTSYTVTNGGETVHFFHPSSRKTSKTPNARITGPRRTFNRFTVSHKRASIVLSRDSYSDYSHARLGAIRKQILLFNDARELRVAANETSSCYVFDYIYIYIIHTRTILFFFPTFHERTLLYSRIIVTAVTVGHFRLRQMVRTNNNRVQKRVVNA